MTAVRARSLQREDDDHFLKNPLAVISLLCFYFFKRNSSLFYLIEAPKHFQKNMEIFMEAQNKIRELTIFSVEVLGMFTLVWNFRFEFHHFGCSHFINSICINNAFAKYLGIAFGTSWTNMFSCFEVLFTIYIIIFGFSIVAPLLFHVRQL